MIRVRSGETVIRVGQLYRDHKGRGRTLARVVDVTFGTIVTMQFIAKRGRKFILPAKYFASSACGWVLVDDVPRGGTLET